MRYIFFLILTILLSITLPSHAQDTSPKIKDFINREILVSDSWTGQSFTLVKEKRDYFIIRKIFGSGIPVTSSFRYEVTFDSQYQIKFSEIVDTDLKNKEQNSCEIYTLRIEENGLSLFLNGFKLIINNSYQDK
jgi:hypothetical protein